MKSKDLFDIVENILKNFPATRDNDKLLCSEIWQAQAQRVTLKNSPSARDFFYLYSHNKLFNHDSITRYRRLLMDKYPPTAPAKAHRKALIKETYI